MGLNCIIDGMRKGKRDGETNVILSPTFIALRFCVPTSFCTYVSPIPQAICLIVAIVTPCRVVGAGDDKLFGIFHEVGEEDKGKELVLKGLKSPLPIDVKDVEVSPLHVTSDLKRVFVGKEYFKINHLLLPPFNLAHGHTLLNKSIVSGPAPKELFMWCLDICSIFQDECLLETKNKRDGY